MDPTSMSYWFPRIEEVGLPVPLTRFMAMTRKAQEFVLACLWGSEAPDTEPYFKTFVDLLSSAASDLGVPYFLRTTHTSGKHQWVDTCFVHDPEQLASHVIQIVEYSECSGLVGPPWDTWAVRELLPTIPVGTCLYYGQMPVCKEFRVFVDGGTVECAHPYWPRHALEQGGCELSDEQFGLLCSMSGDEDEVLNLASRAGVACGGRWSVDLLHTERGWFVTDMAEAHKSFHWEGCERNLDGQE